MSDGVAAHCVFTNRSLFVTITAFVSGISYFTYQVKQSLVCASGAYKEDDQAQDVELWQNAVISGDMATLEALRVLIKTRVLGQRLATLLCGLSGFALLHTRDLTFVDWLKTAFPTDKYSFSHKERMYLGEQGDVDVIKWLVRHKYRIQVEILNGAARKGHLELLQYVHPRHVGILSCAINHMRVAAAYGHLDIVRFFHETQQPCQHRAGFHADRSALDLAATHGFLNIVQYLHEQELPSGAATTEAMDGAAGSGHLEIVQFLHEHRGEGCTLKAVEDATKNGHDAVVAFLRENNLGQESQTRKSTSGQLELLQILDNLTESPHASQKCVNSVALDAILIEEMENFQMIPNCGVVHRCRRELEERMRVEELDELQKTLGRRHIDQVLDEPEVATLESQLERALECAVAAALALEQLPVVLVDGAEHCLASAAFLPLGVEKPDDVTVFVLRSGVDGFASAALLSILVQERDDFKVAIRCCSVRGRARGR